LVPLPTVIEVYSLNRAILLPSTWFPSLPRALQGQSTCTTASAVEGPYWNVQGLWCPNRPDVWPDKLWPNSLDNSPFLDRHILSIRNSAICDRSSWLPI
jgi:hypothetical protein